MHAAAATCAAAPGGTLSLRHLGSRNVTGHEPAGLGRRAFGRAFLGGLAGGVALPVAIRPAVAHAAGHVRLGTLKYGTVQWVAETIRHDHLDFARGFALRTVMLANNDAGRIALMAGAADVVVSDWLFVGAERARGTKLCFAPFSNATGGVMVSASSPIHALPDLKGKRLGVAGGPIDKSWIIVQAAGRKQGIDLAQAANVVYGAPPLLNAKLQQGELDAALTYWNFAARLEATGAREAVSVTDCLRVLGIPGPLTLVGFVFHEDWANRHRVAIDGLLSAATDADRVLAESAAAWRPVRPLMQAPDDALFNSLRRRFIAGIPHETAEQERAMADKVLQILRQTGGARAVANVTSLPQEMFWPVPDDSL